LRGVSRLGGRAKIEVPMYEGNLDVEELLDWVRSMEKNFNYEEVYEEKRVKQAVTRRKGDVVLWLDNYGLRGEARESRR
jgi:hypothetical protein